MCRVAVGTVAIALLRSTQMWLSKLEVGKAVSRMLPDPLVALEEWCMLDRAALVELVAVF